MADHEKTKNMGPLLSVLILLIVTVVATGGAFFWLTSAQAKITEQENAEVLHIDDALKAKVTIVSSEFDEFENSLTIFAANIGKTSVLVSAGDHPPTTVWSLKTEEQDTICTTDWSGSANGPRCVHGCTDELAPGEKRKITIANLGDDALCAISSQNPGTLLFYDVDFGGEAIASAGFVI